MIGLTHGPPQAKMVESVLLSPSNGGLLPDLWFRYVDVPAATLGYTMSTSAGSLLKKRIEAVQLETASALAARLGVLKAEKAPAVTVPRTFVGLSEPQPAAALVSGQKSSLVPNQTKAFESVEMARRLKAKTRRRAVGEVRVALTAMVNCGPPFGTT